jgi:hypothetical protein
MTQMESVRSTSEVRRQGAEARRQAAQVKRAEGEAHNNSEEARAAHPPNEHAADQAILAEQNAENRDSRNAPREERHEPRRVSRQANNGQ